MEGWESDGVHGRGWGPNVCAGRGGACGVCARPSQMLPLLPLHRNAFSPTGGWARSPDGPQADGEVRWAGLRKGVLALAGPGGGITVSI